MAATIDINVANQAYPNPPGGSQALPIPSFVQVPNFPAIPPSFSQGSSTPATPGTDVATQNLVRTPVEEWLVTESGNFQTNNTVGDIESFVVASVVTLANPVRFQIFLTVSTLETLGLSLVGLNAYFPAQAPANSPENVPVRPILGFSDNFIIVARANPVSGSLLTAPSAGDAVRIAVLREGTAAINDTNLPDELDVDVDPAPPIAITVPAQGFTNLGNITASSGVVIPFVGSGQGLPPFIGTFEVEDQVPLGHGLPANVFV